MIQFINLMTIFFVQAFLIQCNLVEYNNNMIKLGEYNFDGETTIDFDNLSSEITY